MRYGNLTNTSKLLLNHIGCHLLLIPAFMYGEWWLTQTENYKHTAFNASTDNRIHLVAVVRNAN